MAKTIYHNNKPFIKAIKLFTMATNHLKWQQNHLPQQYIIYHGNKTIYHGNKTIYHSNKTFITATNHLQWPQTIYHCNKTSITASNHLPQNHSSIRPYMLLYNIIIKCEKMPSRKF